MIELKAKNMRNMSLTRTCKALHARQVTIEFYLASKLSDLYITLLKCDIKYETLLWDMKLTY